MDISIFLAKALGIYLVILSIAMLINANQLKRMLEDTADDYSFIFLTGIMALIIGILLVLVHNVWEADWRVVITIVAWLSLVKGIVRVVFPQVAAGSVEKFIENNVAYYVTVLITLILGIFLVYYGFFV